MNDTFTTIVVPLGLEPNAERAVGVAVALATTANLSVILVTVATSEGQEPDPTRLCEIPTEYPLTRCAVEVLHDRNPARAIAKYVATYDRPLIVMASPVHGVMSEWRSASPIAQLLSEVDCPVLVIGPHVDREWQPGSPRLIACADADWDANAALSEMTCWNRTFAAPTPWILEVIDPDDRAAAGSDTRESSLVVRLAERLALSGVRAEWEVLHDDNPVDALIGFADSVLDGVFVVTTGRWADPEHAHARSVSRQLAHRSTQPVLVVPHAPVAARSASKGT